MSVVIDLDSRRRSPTMLTSLSHPAGVTLPFEGPADAELIVPEIRSEILSGAYSADILRVLPDALRAGDRALVIGAGIGLTSTLAAKTRGVKRVIAVEPNTELFPYLMRTHQLNGVPWVESINAVLGHGVRGRVPFFARHDLRTSSILADECSWQMVMLVPCMELNLILIEERINVVICEVPAGGAELLAGMELGTIERILVSSGDDCFGVAENNDVREVLSGRGYQVEDAGNALMFSRNRSGGENFGRTRQRAGGRAG